MYIIIWKYLIKPEQLGSFIEYYHPQGIWVKFFQQSSYYFETELIQVDDFQFITIDKWSSEEMYRQFLETEKKTYKNIDMRCEKFTTEENFVGSFYQLEI